MKEINYDQIKVEAFPFNSSLLNIDKKVTLIHLEFKMDEEMKVSLKNVSFNFINIEVKLHHQSARTALKLLNPFISFFYLNILGLTTSHLNTQK